MGPFLNFIKDSSHLVFSPSVPLGSLYSSVSLTLELEKRLDRGGRRRGQTLFPIKYPLLAFKKNSLRYDAPQFVLCFSDTLVSLVSTQPYQSISRPVACKLVALQRSIEFLWWCRSNLKTKKTWPLHNKWTNATIQSKNYHLMQPSHVPSRPQRSQEF